MNATEKFYLRVLANEAMILAQELGMKFGDRGHFLALNLDSWADGTLTAEDYEESLTWDGNLEEVRKETLAHQRREFVKAGGTPDFCLSYPGKALVLEEVKKVRAKKAPKGKSDA